ncbi:prepilin-type N-terminal cleavage/methylation domain-containing protein [Acidobacteria bacterium AH-259-L09]|nr:prepilin-type N-terminal cleavage/methylation domain-containing protein [Acidobacteria bacterium AH-259-L09]
MEQQRKVQNSRGFSLVELLIAMLITVVGVLAVATLILYAIQLQSFSRDTSQAQALAQEKMEELRIVDPTDPQRSVGGDLNSNVANHYDEPAGTIFVRRWVVAGGPAGTQDLTIAVVSNVLNVQIGTVQIRALLPQ